MNDEEREELIARYVRGECTEAELKQLSKLIEADPTVLQDFVMAADLEAGFKEALKKSSSISARKPAAAKSGHRKAVARTSHTWIAVTGAVAALLALALLLNLQRQPDPVKTAAAVQAPEGPQIGKVSSASPDVLVIRGGKPIHVSGDTMLRLGDVLRVPARKSARIEYTDKSYFNAGCPIRETVALFTEYKSLPLGDVAVGKKIELDSGEIAGHVEKQPKGQPMLLATPRAVAEILGTQIKLVAEAENTRLDVVEGKVRLHRTADSAFTLVSGGEYAVASREVSEFLPRTMTPKGRMTITCDDRYELYVNGALVGKREWPKAPSHFEAQTYELMLRPDKNVIAVRGANIDNIAGLIAEIQVGPNRLVTSKDWKVSQDVESNWSAVDYDDSRWTSPAEFGKVDEPGKHARATLFPLNSKAQWIWINDHHFSDKNEAHNTVYFRYTFDVSKLDR